MLNFLVEGYSCGWAPRRGVVSAWLIFLRASMMDIGTKILPMYFNLYKYEAVLKIVYFNQY